MARRRVSQTVTASLCQTSFVLATIISATLAAPARAAADQPGAEVIARGKYLADAGDCIACHTKKGGQSYAGGLYLNTPFGRLSSPNITPDKDTGIGSWSDDQFYRVFHEGIGKDGEYIYPAMPYPYYTKVTRDDVVAIKAYLFSLQPVHAPREPNKMEFPFNIRTGLLAWNKLFFHTGEFQPDSAKSPEINRGAYLVEGLGHCGACHNGRILAGNSGEAKQLQGGELQNWYAPNITSDVREGVGKYSDDQLVTYLKSGVAQGVGVANGPMAETIHDSLSKLNDGDLKAIVAFLKSTPAKTSYEAKHDTAFAGPAAVGRDAYLNNCSSCHQLDGKGINGAVASLVGDAGVLAEGPQDVIRVILGGIEAKGSNAPMPAVGAGMSDQDIADVTNYVRQAWGNAAPATAAAGTVGDLRSSTVTGLNLRGDCPAIDQPGIAAAVADPKSGIGDALKGLTLANVEQTAEEIVPKLKAAAPHAQQADIVNALTYAYCPVIKQDAQVTGAQKVIQYNNFSDQVYSVLKTNGKE
jgi:mono/diheme cytochrome c family protein